MQGFPNEVDWWGDNLGKVAKKLHENYKIGIFGQSRWGHGETSQFFGILPPPQSTRPPLGEFLLWSVKVIKQLVVPFTWTLSGMFTSLVYLIPLQFILLAVSLLDFVYVVLTAFCNRWWYFAFSIRCIFDVLSAKVSFFLMNAISLNLCVTSFENNFLLCGI